MGVLEAVEELRLERLKVREMIALEPVNVGMVKLLQFDSASWQNYLPEITHLRGVGLIDGNELVLNEAVGVELAINEVLEEFAGKFDMSNDGETVTELFIDRTPELGPLGTPVINDGETVTELFTNGMPKLGPLETPVLSDGKTVTVTDVTPDVMVSDIVSST